MRCSCSRNCTVLIVAVIVVDGAGDAGDGTDDVDSDDDADAVKKARRMLHELHARRPADNAGMQPAAVAAGSPTVTAERHV